MKYQFDSDQELLSFLKSQLISAAEAADILGVCVRRIRALVDLTGKNQSRIFLKQNVEDKKKELEEVQKNTVHTIQVLLV